MWLWNNCSVSVPYSGIFRFKWFTLNRMHNLQFSFSHARSISIHRAIGRNNSVCLFHEQIWHSYHFHFCFACVQWSGNWKPPARVVCMWVLLKRTARHFLCFNGNWHRNPLQHLSDCVCTRDPRELIVGPSAATGQRTASMCSVQMSTEGNEQHCTAHRPRPCGIGHTPVRFAFWCGTELLDIYNIYLYNHVHYRIITAPVLLDIFVIWNGVTIVHKRADVATAWLYRHLTARDNAIWYVRGPLVGPLIVFTWKPCAVHASRAKIVQVWLI